VKFFTGFLQFFDNPRPEPAHNAVIMNTRILLVIGSLILPGLSATAQWGQPAQPQINVSGSAEIKVAPDEVDLNVSVETRDENLEVAKAQNDERIARALDFLKRSGVKDKDVQTDFISVEPVYPPNQNYLAQTKPAFYRVSKGIGIKLTAVGSFDGLLTGLITNGVNNVQGIDFRTTELRKYKDQARAMAIRAAREKAEAMAGELGVKVGKPYNITVNDAGGWISWGGRGFGGGFNGMQNLSQNAVANGGGPEADGATFAVGQISVSASVNVSFVIQ
jgi:uncharacterized protein YggE